MNRRSIEDEPQRSRRADARRSRAAIVAAAARELKGGRRLSAPQLAATAQVSRSTVYRYFPSEDACSAALVRRPSKRPAPRFGGP